MRSISQSWLYKQSIIFTVYSEQECTLANISHEKHVKHVQKLTKETPE